MVGAVERDHGAVGEHVRHHQPADQPQDDPPVEVQGPPLRLPEEPLPGRHQHPYDYEDVEDVHHGPEAYRVHVAQQALEASVLVDAVEQEVQRPHLEDDEPPPDEAVQHA